MIHVRGWSEIQEPNGTNISALETGHRCLRFLRLTFKVGPGPVQGFRAPVIGSSCFFNQPFFSHPVTCPWYLTSGRSGRWWNFNISQLPWRNARFVLLFSWPLLCLVQCSSPWGHAEAQFGEKDIEKLHKKQEITCQKNGIPFHSVFERNVWLGITQVCDFLSLCKMLHIPNILACALDRYSAAKHLQEDLQVSRWTKVRIPTNQSLVLHITVTHPTELFVDPENADEGSTPMFQGWSDCDCIKGRQLKYICFFMFYSCRIHNKLCCYFALDFWKDGTCHLRSGDRDDLKSHWSLLPAAQCSVSITQVQSSDCSQVVTDPTKLSCGFFDSFGENIWTGKRP